MKIPGVLLVCALTLPIMGDEGMWLFNEFPKDAVKKAYNFEVSDGFLDSLRLASVRIGGSSGSFVSAGGLMLTNREAVANCVAKLSAPGHDYVKDGFYAASNPEEKACAGMQASVLVAIEDVTSQIKEPPKEATKNAKPVAAAVLEKAAAEALAKRNAAIARIEKDCAAKTGDACTVVSLSSGERYHLYHYKNYTDLRLVFAPELAMAFFGGDAATFTYQRYELDIAFLRAYENGKPAATPHYLKWSSEGVKDTDLLFVVGNPAATSRLDTAAQLTYYRDTEMPLRAQRLAARIDMLSNFTPKTDESRRVAEAALSQLGLAYKSTAGLLIGLRDERLMIRKVNFEKRLRTAVEHDTKLGSDAGKVWDDVAAAYSAWTPFEKPYEVLEEPAALGSSLFRIARQVLRLSEERSKPSDQRLPEYRDTALPSLELELYSPAPIDDATEIALLTQYLEEIKAFAKKDTQFKKLKSDTSKKDAATATAEKETQLDAILGSKTPAQAAADFVTASKLKDVAERRRLVETKGAAAQSDDGMLRLVRALDGPARDLLKKHRDTIEARAASAWEKIAQDRFRIWGTADYPDATSTPRISFGAVKAYHDRTEAAVVFATTFGGLFHLAGPKEPFKLPQRWVDAKPRLDLIAPFDFVSTCDISAGSSGSPTVNKNGELVGMVFDANLEALPSTYMYTDDLARAVHVATQGMAEALEVVYKATPLVKELGVPERKKNGTE